MIRRCTSAAELCAALDRGLADPAGPVAGTPARTESGAEARAGARAEAGAAADARAAAVARVGRIVDDLVAAKGRRAGGRRR